jgi:alkylation response protein AidB-like acyl-CoA dehydrogenase
MTGLAATETLAAVRDLAPLIARHADETERERRLARLVVDALVDSGVFCLLLPTVLGGPGGDPLNFARSATPSRR